MYNTVSSVPNTTLTSRLISNSCSKPMNIFSELLIIIGYAQAAGEEHFRYQGSSSYHTQHNQSSLRSVYTLYGTRLVQNTHALLLYYCSSLCQL